MVAAGKEASVCHRAWEPFLADGQTRAEVAVGDDADLVASLQQCAGLAGLGHHRGGLADGGLQRAPDHRTHLIARRAQGLVDQPGPGQPLPGDQRPVVAELQTLWVLQCGARVGEPVAQGVLGSSDAQRRRQTRQHRDLTEGLTGPEHVDGPAAVENFDLAGADDVEVGQGRTAGFHDGGSRGEVFDFDQTREGVEVGGVEGIVGGLPTQEVDVLTHPSTRSLRPRPLRATDCGRAPRSRG